MSAPVTKRVSGNEAWYLIMGIKAGVQLFKKCKSSVFYCVKDGDGGDGGDGGDDGDGGGNDDAWYLSC